jgi:hypothetical protein
VHELHAVDSGQAVRLTAHATMQAKGVCVVTCMPLA